MSTDVRICFLSAPDLGCAEKLARGLVEEGLAACVNVLPGSTSFYKWEGALQVESEVLLLAKTSTRQYSQLEEWVLARHPYSCPELIAVPVERGSAGYLSWIEAMAQQP